MEVRAWRRAVLRLVGPAALVLGTCGALATPSVHAASIARSGRGWGAISACSREGRSCSLALLAFINRDRAAHGLPALRFDKRQARGTRSCVGSKGKIRTVAETGFLWHVSAKFPQASFPADICGRYVAAGENLGYAYGSKMGAIRVLEDMMMREGPQGDHYRNLMSSSFNRVGIWITRKRGAWYLAEDFLR